MPGRESKGYQERSKNQEKINDMTEALSSRLNAFLTEKPTAQVVLSFEINIQNGGLASVFMESTVKKERI